MLQGYVQPKNLTNTQASLVMEAFQTPMELDAKVRRNNSGSAKSWTFLVSNVKVDELGGKSSDICEK